MAGWMTTEEALRYFGLGDDVDELERIVVEYGLDADFDDDRRITRVDGNDAGDALFAEHEKQIGYRPDDPTAMARVRRNAEQRENRAKAKREEKRTSLVRRVQARARRG